MSNFEYKTLSLLVEGTIYALLALGIFVSFEWARFPDLSPDGTFVVGAWGYLAALSLGGPLWLGIIAGMLLGASGGILTAATNRLLHVPAVIAGLITSFALYSVVWLLMGRPNTFVRPEQTLGGRHYGTAALYHLLPWSVAFLIAALVALTFFGSSVWGLRLRALGENRLLAADLRSNEGLYALIGVGLGNGLAGVAGALTVQRTFSTDVGMGFGVTIAGLACMIIGLNWSRDHWGLSRRLTAVAAGALTYKLILFLAFQAGLRPESYRLVSAAIIVLAFLLTRSRGSHFLRGLKWS